MTRTTPPDLADFGDDADELAAVAGLRLALPEPEQKPTQLGMLDAE